jgi:hypothetical protein
MYAVLVLGAPSTLQLGHFGGVVGAAAAFGTGSSKMKIV